MTTAINQKRERAYIALKRSMSSIYIYVHHHLTRTFTSQPDEHDFSNIDASTKLSDRTALDRCPVTPVPLGFCPIIMPSVNDVVCLANAALPHLVDWFNPSWNQKQVMQPH